jgi:Tol biopolymer transport system component
MNHTWRLLSVVALFVGISAVDSPAGATVTDANGKIAFTRYDLIADRGSVFTIDPDGTDETQVGAGEDVICPAWSPNGSRVLVCDFLPVEGARPATANPDGSNFAILDAYPALQQALTCSGWSPDEARFICTTDVGSGNPNPADNGLYTLRSSDGGDLQRVTVTPEGYDDTNAEYSPDGSRILFSRLSDDAPSSLLAVAPDGTDLIRLNPQGLSPLDTPYPADWSPDGSQVTFAAAWKQSNGRGRGTALYVVNSDGTGLRQITPSGVGAVSAQWSPNGQLIAFTSKFRAQPQVWVVRPDGTDLRKVTDSANGTFSETPVWSPDGSKLLFLRGDHSGQFGLWTVNADGSALSQVTTIAASAGYDWGTAPASP